jgi:hypothetical protein
LSLNQLKVYENCLILHKMHHNLLKCGFALVSNSVVTNRITRQSHLLRLPDYRSFTAQNSLFYNGLKYYNSLPASMKTVQNLVTFKKLLKAHVFYSIGIS